MCRLQSCRDPARVSGSNPSKYCSDEHGKEYMQNHVLKQDLEAVKAGGSKSGNNKKRRRDDSSNTGNDRDMEDELEIDDAPSYLRGGVLRATELKALTGGVKNLSEFRKLGEGVLSPPRTASPDNDVQMDDADGASTKSKAAVSYTAEESSQLTEIAEKNDALKTRKSLLGDREKFLGLVKARAKSVLEELKKRDTELKRKDVVKDICGYDVRLSWSDEEFQQWRASPEGLDILTSGVLGPPAIVPAYAPELFEDLASPQPKGSNTAKDPVPTVGDDVEIGRGVCQKRHCVRHKTWWKLQQQDMALEKEEVRLGMRKLEEDEKGVRDRAMIRCLESGDGGS